MFPGITDTPSLVALPYREALALADDLSLKRIAVASDYKQVINDITDDIGGQHASIIKDINIHRIALSFDK
jgi:hypothetical protein